MAKDTQMWSPLRELDRVRHDFDDLLDRFFGNRAGVEGHFGSPALPIESFIDNNNLIVRADLPGIDPKQVEITVTGDELTIRGKRERSHEEKGRNFIQREVSYGEFERTVKLPAGIKSDEVKAAYRNGVLELTVPLREHVKSRTVPIQVEAGPDSPKQ